MNMWFKNCTLPHDNPTGKTLWSQNLSLRALRPTAVIAVYPPSTGASVHTHMEVNPRTWEAEKHSPSEGVSVFQRHDIHDGANNVS